jgi:predicted Rossmann fold nucleotide-binding protein DprA/Smf involved in DNA uptake
MDDKLLHVSCIVRPGGLYDLLRSLEVHKVGNVEVRPVAPVLALPPPEKKRRRKDRVKQKVLAAMPLKEIRTTRQLVAETDANPKSIYSALFYLVKTGIVKHVGTGQYTRVKDGNQ